MVTEKSVVEKFLEPPIGLGNPCHMSNSAHPDIDGHRLSEGPCRNSLGGHWGHRQLGVSDSGIADDSDVKTLLSRFS